MFSFRKKLLNSFYSICIILYSHQQGISNTVGPHPCSIGQYQSFNFSNSSGYEVVSRFGFTLHF